MSVDILDEGEVVDTLGNFSLFVIKVRVVSSGKAGWMASVKGFQSILENSKVFDEDKYEEAKTEGQRVMRERHDKLKRRIQEQENLSSDN